MVNSVKEGIPISVALDKQQPDAQAASASTAPYYSSWDSGETEPVTPWPGDPAPQAAEPGPTWGPVLREIVETIVLTLVIFLLVRTVIQNFRVEGMSMEPNFHDGQFLLINKLAYRLGDPARGDVIVFRYPLDPSRDFIKRVIGLPGETVEIRNGQVLINNQPISDPATVNSAFYNMAPLTLGAEEMFVLGDNRPNSSDSHSWGTVPADKVIGKVVLSYWPPPDWGLIRHGMADPGFHPADN
ncbi:MAG: signal peptidase I [Anaerolinea sp.]|nr:signal peptidase I [Anaerolinea sp.]